MIEPNPRSGAAADPAEEAAWQALVARWGDPLAHRDYLAGTADLDGLARAGARYRAVLAEHPDDPVAAAGRDEVLRRATILGLASTPRVALPAGSPNRARWAILGALAVAAVAVASWAANSFLLAGAGR